MGRHYKANNFSWPFMANCSLTWSRLDLAKLVSCYIWLLLFSLVPCHQTHSHCPSKGICNCKKSIRILGNNKSLFSEFKFYSGLGWDWDDNKKVLCNQLISFLIFILFYLIFLYFFLFSFLLGFGKFDFLRRSLFSGY